MFKKLVLTMSSLCLILAFQNCKQSDVSGAAGADQKIGASGVNTAAPLISDQPLQSMTFYFGGSGPVEKTASTREELQAASRPSSLQLDLATGHIEVAGDQRNFCIDDSEVSELKEILKQASICRSIQKNDQVCSTVYESPYAVMHFVDKDLNLGESRSSCDKVDLCDAYPDLVKGFFAGVVSNLDSKVCSQ